MYMLTMISPWSSGKVAHFSCFLIVGQWLRFWTAHNAVLLWYIHFIYRLISHRCWVFSPAHVEPAKYQMQALRWGITSTFKCQAECLKFSNNHQRDKWLIILRPRQNSPYRLDPTRHWTV
ncbi:predicted protein [Coccidioides posadasii str. Silveira]|uniref:Predicted protein n=1 Tax=Coccidioides posadasii (strain RMSCC 757 / Silveira) TaxID=443226 RepID=E9D6S8_COCPS|nr:predicted protein [Coccidioides posadasii str. Silveira]